MVVKKEIIAREPLYLKDKPEERVSDFVFAMIFRFIES